MSEPVIPTVLDHIFTHLLPEISALHSTLAPASNDHKRLVSLYRSYSPAPTPYLESLISSLETLRHEIPDTIESTTFTPMLSSAAIIYPLPLPPHTELNVIQQYESCKAEISHPWAMTLKSSSDIGRHERLRLTMSYKDTPKKAVVEYTLHRGKPAMFRERLSWNVTQLFHRRHDVIVDLEIHVPDGNGNRENGRYVGVVVYTGEEEDGKQDIETKEKLTAMTRKTRSEGKLAGLVGPFEDRGVEKDTPSENTGGVSMLFDIVYKE
ncbi:hypothetical protein H072_7386 [Dactylellina haptotyla CBS 200.50]|uniref:Uncharacterized protein n=1 Tax=Dactylellina haptotyla (strain CBS 200.50) TaxID=1284197 RepID=S8A7S7_DACHA|nr:hypothetical protein H072_7386 [Dactylellina haptotyla CBS 200.50]